MLIGEAKAIARQWVTGEAAGIPGFHGALLHGSVVGRSDSAEHPAGSDLDLLIPVEGAIPASGAGKRDYGGLLLDVTYLPIAEIESPPKVLGRYQLAGSFRPSAIIADPSGELAPLCAAVAAAFADRQWVLRRRGDARDNVFRHLASASTGDPWPARVTSWLFAAGVTTHILLVAGLVNPTVRSRYVAVRALLEGLALLPVHEELLALLGSAHITKSAVQGHLDALAPAFDAAAITKTSSVPFSSDISVGGRAMAIDGSQRLIDQGFHREAVFWIVATYARCLAVLHASAPESARRRFEFGLSAVLADLGISSADDLERRKSEVAALIPYVWSVSERIADSLNVDEPYK